jgi:hypothetical protein
VFDLSDLSQPQLIASLTGSYPLREDGFYGRVAIDGNLAVLSARSANPVGHPELSTAGAAYVFDVSNPEKIIETRLSASDAQAGDEMGVSAAIDHRRVILGASADTIPAGRWGSAYVFQVIPEPTSLFQISLAAAALLRRRAKPAKRVSRL